MASQPSKLIVIIGATGAQGGSVLTSYLNSSTHRIRALTRDTTTPTAIALAQKSPNIEVVSADLSDPSTLTRAFADATAIFAVVNWQDIYQGLVTQNATPPNGMSLNEHACRLETEQAMNVFAAASRVHTLERLVFSSAPHVSRLSHGKYTRAHHFDSKAVAVERLQTQCPELWRKTSLVHMGIYLENFLTRPLYRPRRDREGSDGGSGVADVVFEMLGGEEQRRTLWPYVVAGEDTGPVVQALVERVPAGKTVLVSRGLQPLSELVGSFEEVTGLKARIQYGKQMEGMPEELKSQFEDAFAFAVEFGFEGVDDRVVTPDALGINLGSVRDWVRRQDWNAVLGE